MTNDLFAEVFLKWAECQIIRNKKWVSKPPSRWSRIVWTRFDKKLTNFKQGAILNKQLLLLRFV